MTKEKTHDFNIDYVAQLARIELTAAEKEEFGNQLGKVIDYFERLDQVDVEGIEPAAHAHPLWNVWDEDVPGPVLSPSEALANAPAQRDDQVVVPRVVEEQ